MKTTKKDECSYSFSNAIRTLAMVVIKGFNALAARLDRRGEDYA